MDTCIPEAFANNCYKVAQDKSAAVVEDNHHHNLKIRTILDFH